MKENLVTIGKSVVVVLLAALTLILIGYWVINALEHSRRFQRCLDSGRVNCVDFVNPAK